MAFRASMLGGEVLLSLVSLYFHIWTFDAGLCGPSIFLIDVPHKQSATLLSWLRPHIKVRSIKLAIANRYEGYWSNDAAVTTNTKLLCSRPGLDHAGQLQNECNGSKAGPCLDDIIIAST